MRRLGRPLPLQAVHLSGELPAHAEHYPDFFGTCPVQVGQSAERLVFAADALQASLPLAEPVTHFEAVRHCRSVQDSFRPEASPLISQLSAQLEQQLDAPPSSGELAAQLHCTSRTLRRHLQRAGCGYHSCSTACAFSAPSCASFRHAFQRWSGTTPRAWRQQLPSATPAH
ncbi:AraC family transcriptional regulator ligand-binding domain-containing protein [Halopseudomonas pachastrellae]|nr:AraC family transcriptional regulator ligand-binding domain-containing protein [Halopseudomonas pachastrellae]